MGYAFGSKIFTVSLFCTLPHLKNMVVGLIGKGAIFETCKCIAKVLGAFCLFVDLFIDLLLICLFLCFKGLQALMSVAGT